MLHRYAIWHLLRRLRTRNRSAETTYGQADLIRQQVRAAIAMLDWLHSRRHTIATCTQADFDEWLTNSDVNYRLGAGHFVRWVAVQNINRNLDFAAIRWTGPTQPLDHEQRWRQTKRLLHDDTLKVDDRVAGLLVLLYVQQVAAISRLRTNDVDPSDDAVGLHLGSVPIILPEPVADLVRELIATRQGRAVVGDQGDSAWLLPGGQPGRPISADRLRQRLRGIGISTAQARSTALFQLATELPAALLARLLGIHIKAAVQWQHVSAGDWANYAADVSRRKPSNP